MQGQSRGFCPVQLRKPALLNESRRVGQAADRVLKRKGSNRIGSTPFLGEVT